jgi:NTE family protein
MSQQYDLVFEGGGAKGSTFVGAMRAFYEKGYTTRRLVGTSAGAITATLLAAGFTPDEMLAAVNERDTQGKPRFASFMDPPKASDFSQADKDNSDTMQLFKDADVPFIPDWMEDGFDRKLIDALMILPHYRQLFCFVECGGLFAGDKFLTWLKEKLALKNPAYAEATLAQFYKITNNDLSLVTSDTDVGEMLVLNHRTAPDCPVAWAVRMSMSIPFVWREVVWKQEWGSYLGKNITGHRLVDGGVLSNFPIALVDKQPKPGSHAQAVMGDTIANDAGTIGLLIDESLEVPGQPKKSQGLGDRLKIIKRVTRLVDTMTGAHDNIEIRTHEQLICRLPAAGYGTTEFDMEANRLKALIDAGYTAMKNHLS